MNTSSLLKIGTPCLLLGAVGGFVVGQLNTHAPDPVSGSASSHTGNALTPTATPTGKQKKATSTEPPNFSAKLSSVLENDVDGQGYLRLLEEAFARGHPYTEASLIQALESMRPSDGVAVFELLGKLLKDRLEVHGEIVWHAYWRRFGAVDPLAALELAEKDRAKNPTQDRLKKYLFSGWADRDPLAAMSHVAGNENLADRKRCAEGVAVVWSRKDPHQATQWSLKHLTGDIQATAIGAIQWGSIATLGPKKTLDALSQIPPGPSQTRALSSLTEALISLPQITAEDRKKAVEQLRDQTMPTAELVKIVGLEMMASSTPAQAANYLTNFPPPPDQPHYYGFGQVMSRWAAQDGEASGNWLNAQSGKPWYDSAVSGYVMGIKDNDPQAAEAWMAKIKSQEVKAMVK